MDRFTRDVYMALLMCLTNKTANDVYDFIAERVRQDGYPPEVVLRMLAELGAMKHVREES